MGSLAALYNGINTYNMALMIISKNQRLTGISSVFRFQQCVSSDQKKKIIERAMAH